MAEIEDAEAFLAAPKEAIGDASWAEGARPGLLRLEWPLSIEGQSTGGRLIVSAVSIEKEPQFTILLVQGKCLSRLEYDLNASHINPMNGPKGVPRGRINGPHFHALADNRRLVERGLLPRDLKYARPLPHDLRELRACLRWFCELNNIILRNDQVPSEPQQPRLL